MIMSAAIESISPDDAVLLTACEQTIAEGMESFKSVGRALVEIRDSRLYRATHATFEDYCRDRWNWSRRRAYQLIEAAVVLDASPECAKFCTSESQARELAKVEPELRAEVLQAAAESGKVTAKSIREAAKPAQQDEATPVPMDAETRASHVSLKIKGWTDAVKEHVASLNPSRAELIQAGQAFKKLGADLERAAAQLSE
jgi:hypothetical protein